MEAFPPRLIRHRKALPCTAVTARRSGSGSGSYSDSESDAPIDVGGY